MEAACSCEEQGGSDSVLQYLKHVGVDVGDASFQDNS